MGNQLFFSAPPLRFEEFKDEWKEASLGDLVENFEYGLNASSKEYDGKNKYLRITDINEVTRKFSTNNLTSPNVNLSLSSNYILEESDVLFARTGASVGKTYIYEKTDGIVYFAGFLIRARIKKDHNPQFVFQNTLTSNYNNFVKVTSQRSGQPGINAQEYSNYRFKIPGFNEQEKIGLFLKKFDDTISLHQQELEALKQTKQGFLQKMFPKDGENVPQIRFNEFSEPWTQIEFGKVIKLVGGATPLKENKEYWNGDIVWLSSQEIKNKYVSKGTYLITEQAVKDNRTKVVSEGTPLIVTRSGILAKRFPISISLNEVAINQDIKALIFDRERFDTEFIVAEIKSKELYILNNIVKTGTTVQSVNLPDLNRMNLHIPEYAEQLKIGKFFRELDEVIDLKEKELEALKETKKGFLQKMFV